MLPTFYTFWDLWQLYHKVTIDGTNRLFIINDGETAINIKTDVYSAWKEWSLLEDNLKFVEAISSVGGQPLPGGGFLGDTYFLENGWKLKLTGSVAITGNLYTSDASSAFVVEEGIQIAQSTVSQLVQTTVPNDYSTNIAQAVWNTQPDNSGTIANAVWQEPITSHGSPKGTMGHQLTKNVLTTVRYIALK